MLFQSTATRPYFLGLAAGVQSILIGLQHRWRNMKQVPATSRESDSMSKDLKKRGFSFVGSTICYAFMQASGMVNDHVTACFRYRELN